MASILRSAKFVRYVAGFARNIVINPPREFDGNLVQNTQCFCGNLQRSLATQANVQRNNDQSLERSLRRLDQDVRRSGRISRRDIEDILEEIRHTRSATSSQSLLVIRCCGNLVPEELPEVRTKLVQEIWNTLNKLNIPMDISHYNALLRVYLENEHPFSPTEFLSDLEAKGIEPNRVTYQRLISQYCQLGDIEGATRILEFMREKQLPVNENVFNALIMGHSQTDDMEGARGILSVMQQASLEASADTYTVLLCGYARAGDMKQIAATLAECETKDIQLLDKDYLDVVYSLAINGHDAHVPDLLAKVRGSVGYTQDAINLVLRLVNRGREGAGIEVLRSMPDAKTDGAALLVRQLVRAGRPLETIVRVCETLRNEELHPQPLLYAAETSLQVAEPALAYPLLKQLQEAHGLAVKQHFFWPLLVARGKENNEQGVLEVVRHMVDFNLNPSAETVREYVLPYVRGKTDDILDKLRSSGASIGVAASSLLHKYLGENKAREAANIARRINAYYPPPLVRRPLTKSYLHTGDLESFVAIVRAMHDHARQQRDDAGGVVDVVGHTAFDVAAQVRPNDVVETVEKMLRGLVAEGLSMSSTYAERIQERLGEKLTADISDLLGRMTSGELVPVTKERPEPHYVPSSAMNAPQLERLVANLEAKGENTSGLKRQLLSLYTRAKDLGKTEALLASLDSDPQFMYTAGVHAQLIDLYAHHGDLANVLKHYGKIAESKEAIDDLKLIKVVTLMIEKATFDEALTFLERPYRKSDPPSYNYTALVWRLLNKLAEEARVAELERLFHVLVAQKLVTVNNVILGPLIKARLVQGDIVGAVDKFEWCVNQYKATPWKNELACRLIEREDGERLQRVTDLSTTIHGEVNSLYDLVLAFVECGRVRQARRILETPGLQSRPQRLAAACEKYRERGSVEHLERLKDATKELSHIDRGDIYCQLQASYAARNEEGDVDRALALWTEMQEEDVRSDRFLVELAAYMRARGRPVPFVVPEGGEAEEPPLGGLRRSLHNGDVDAALQFKERLANERELTVADWSRLLELAARREESTDTVGRLLVDMVGRDVRPTARVFRFALNRLAAAGRTDVLEVLGARLAADVKRLVSFDNRLCHAHIVAGTIGAYLDTLHSEIDNAKDEHVAILAEKFPRGGAVGILEKCPADVVERYELLARKYAARGQPAPLNVLWAHRFISGEGREAADALWRDHLRDAPRLMFQRVVQVARERCDAELAARLVAHLRYNAPAVSAGALGNACSCLLDVLATQGRRDEAVAALHEAAAHPGVRHLNRTALLRVKSLYDERGDAFPYAVPDKKSSAAASTSSSNSGSSSEEQPR